MMTAPRYPYKGPQEATFPGPTVDALATPRLAGYRTVNETALDATVFAAGIDMHFQPS
jgi:hypothetical protein